MIVAGAILAIGLSTSTVSTDGTLGLRHDVQVDRAQVELADLLDLSPLPRALQPRAASVSVAMFRPGQTRMRFSAAWLKERARAQLPALTPWLKDVDGSSIVILLRDAGRSAPMITPAPSLRTLAHTTCLRVVQPVAANSIPTIDDFAAANCGEIPPSPVMAYDADHGVVRATHNLRVGELIAAPPAFALPVVRPGQRLYVRTRIGPVVIEREVEAVQAAWSDKPVFVKTTDQTVFSASFAESQP